MPVPRGEGEGCGIQVRAAADLQLPQAGIDVSLHMYCAAPTWQHLFGCSLQAEQTTCMH